MSDPLFYSSRCEERRELTRAFVLSPFRNFDEAIRVMQRATTTPKNTKISYHDEVSPFSSLSSRFKLDSRPET